jgi:aminopeptidase N
MPRAPFFAAFFAVLLLQSYWSVPLAAGPAEDPPAGEPMIGEGAAACAEGKSARAATLSPAAFSAASTNIDITYYHLNLTLPMVTDNLSGVVRVEGRVVGSALSTLVLDLAATMTVTAVTLPDATPLAFTHPGAVLNITLPGTVPVGGTVAVDVAYNGFPSGGGFGYFTFGTRAGDRFAWSLSEPYGARQWWPCKDHPSDKADSVRVTVTVPSLYRVGSQGLLVGETPSGGNTTYDWKSDYPISSYLVSIAVGQYVRYQGTYNRPAPLAALYGPLAMPLDHLVYDDGSSGLFTGWASVGDPISVLEDWFGPYPFANEKYGHAEFTFSGGMEHQTMSSMGGSTLSLVTHELAHQWYGDGISPRTWPHLWLNEGFASYAELIYWKDRQSTYPGTYQSVLYNYYNNARYAQGTLVLEDTSSVNEMFDYYRVYMKGSMVLYMLHNVVGDAVFKEIMQTYATDPAVRYGVATTADFKGVAESISGLDLDAFFTQWVETGTGYPSYAMYSFWQPDFAGTSYKVWVTVTQTQTMPQSNVNVFEMPLVIAVQTTGGEVRAVVQNDQRVQTFELTVTDQPTAVAIDPDKWILRSDLIATGVGPVALRTDIVSVYPNPVSGAFSLQYVLDEESRVEIEVFDVAGRRVLSRVTPRAAAGARTEALDATSLPAGVYFVRLATARTQTMQKFVVLR